jgi:hypothetical protein
VRRGDPDFDEIVLLLGVITRIELDVQPSNTARQE